MASTSTAFAPTKATTEYGFIPIGGNSVKAVTSIGYGADSASFPLKRTILTSIVADDTFEELEYETLIRCLARKESSSGLNRNGDNGESRGLLHYWRWWEPDSLWGGKCVAEYGFDDIENDRQQVLCADRLFRENFSLYIKRWTSSNKCLQK